MLKTKFVNSGNESRIKVERKIGMEQSEMRADKIYQLLSNRDEAVLNSALG